MQWWSQRQSLYLQRQAEEIRDGLLQDLFTMRRNLELGVANGVEISAQNCQTWLAQIEKVHHALEQLGNSLSPPYIEESLPLAIQYLLERGKILDAQTHFCLEVPSQWSDRTPEYSRIVLMALYELLRIAMPKSLVEQPLSIRLAARQERGELTVQIVYPDKTKLATFFHLKELKYLSQAFQLLTSGSCACQSQGTTLTWRFCWHLQAVKA